MKIILTKQEIIKAFNFSQDCEIEVVENREPTTINDDYFFVDFPEMTAKEIVESCDNKIESGKLLWNIDWYQNEEFFTKEKTRQGRRLIYKELLHGGKSWNEINKLKGNNEMLNFAEVVYLLKEFSEYRELLKFKNMPCYTWTSSRASDGRIVSVGGFGEDGVNVDSDTPVDRDGAIGVSFSRSE